MQPVIAGIENLIECLPGLPRGFGAPLAGSCPTVQPTKTLGLHLVLTVFVLADMIVKVTFEAAPTVGVRILGDYFCSILC